MKTPMRVLLAVAVATALAALAAGCGDSATDDPSAGGNNGPAARGDMAAVFQQALDPLVDDGTITAQQEDAVLAAITASMPAGGPQGAQESSPPSTPEERPGPGAMFSSALDDLVDDGTLTAAQSEAVLAALSAAMPQRDGAAPPGAPSAETQSL